MQRRFTAPMREMLALQPRFGQVKGRRGLSMLEHRRFRAAYDFMVLRAEIGGVPPSIARFWTEVQEQGIDQRLRSFGIDGKPASKQRKRRPRRRKPAADHRT